MVGADNSPYTGDGQVIAIIDSGVDVEHEAFQGQVPTDALTEGKLSELTGRLHAGNGALAAAQLRVDDKFPFAYDYADRGSGGAPGEIGRHPAVTREIFVNLFLFPFTLPLFCYMMGASHIKGGIHVE